MKDSEAESIRITTDRDKMDMDVIMDFMNHHSYWAKDRDRATMQKAMDNSLCFGIFSGERMAGFGRVVTDYATMYYLCDLFISPEYQGKGLGKKLTQAILEAPELEGLYGMLLTKDAHDLYRRFGFSDAPEAVERFMIKRDWTY